MTDKFPVMTAGTPRATPADRWTFSIAVEAPDMAIDTVASWDYRAFRDLPVREITCDIHCVSRWSKLDTRWRGVDIADILAAAGLRHDGEAASPVRPVAQADDAPPLPLRFAYADCDGDYRANLKLVDIVNGGGFVALDFDAGDGFQPIPEPHGGPARLLIPKLYLWKSAKWIRRLTISPFDRKGYWERLGYHNYGDPWREQRYRGLSDDDKRTTLDPSLARKVREERLRRKRGDQ